MPSHPRPPVQKFDRRAQHGRSTAAIAIAALILALVAVGLSVWAALRPAGPTSAPQFSSAQQANAKTAGCAAADLVRRGVSLNTNLQSPGGTGDVTGSYAVAANARLALSDGGLYLRAQLPPATPPELAESITKFADTLMAIGAAATAGALNTDPDQVGRLQDADVQYAKVVELCR